MVTLSFRQVALDDLNDIYRYTVETWSEAQADTYYQLIKTTCYDLAKGIHSGRNFTDISDGLLGYHVGKHMIFFLLDDSSMQVIRILHERMDYQRHL